MLPCPKLPAEPNAGADCPKAGAAAVLLLEPKLNAGVLLGEALVLPPKLKVEVLAGAAAGAGVGLLEPKAKPGVLEAPKPFAVLLGADAALLCPKAKDGVLLAGGATAGVVWVAPNPNAGVELLVGFAPEPKLKAGVLLLAAEPAGLLGWDPPKAKVEDAAGADAMPVPDELLPNAKEGAVAGAAAVPAAGAALLVVWPAPKPKAGGALLVGLEPKPKLKPGVLLGTAAGAAVALLLWPKANVGAEDEVAAGCWPGADPKVKGAAAAVLVDGVTGGAAVVVLARPKSGVEVGTGAVTAGALCVGWTGAVAPSACFALSPEPALVSGEGSDGFAPNSPVPKVSVG